MKGILNKTAIVAALRRLGLQPTCDLMVHTALSSLGAVEGGAETVVDALRETAGPDGAVIVPCFRHAIRSDKYCLTQCANCPSYPLCPSREEGTTGAVGETVREQPDSLRSCSPGHTWVGIGGDARFLLEGHIHSLTPCGTDSPFFRLMERDGQVLLLGVDVNAFTNVHAVEDARNVPYLSAYDPARHHATYTTSGRRLQYVFPELLRAALREAGILKLGRVGASMSYVLSARAVGAFLWVATEADPWCLVLRPRGNQYEPFADACIKAASMVRSWKANPDGDAWQLLLQESKRERTPVYFEPAKNPAIGCPAYRGVIRGYPRCAANDVPPWEKFEDYPPFEPGAATCEQCNWPLDNPS